MHKNGNPYKDGCETLKRIFLNLLEEHPRLNEDCENTQHVLPILHEVYNVNLVLHESEFDDRIPERYPIAKINESRPTIHLHRTIMTTNDTIQYSHLRVITDINHYHLNVARSRYVKITQKFAYFKND